MQDETQDETHNRARDNAHDNARGKAQDKAPGKLHGKSHAKAKLRKKLRLERRQHIARAPDTVSGLLFRQMPSPVAALIAKGAIVGLYSAAGDEAPTRHYACALHEAGHTIALPHFSDKQAPMTFARYTDPLSETGLVTGPFGVLQPGTNAQPVTPDIVFVPVVGFTQDGERLGQGGGHYDRWLARNPPVQAIGLAWDCQLVDALPLEPHDRRLDAVITPTRLYGRL